MGQITSRLADHVYLTDDETHTEDPEIIRQQVFEGVDPKNRDKVRVIADREEAIKKAIQTANKDDIVLITGIGHQITRNMSDQNIPWSDLEVAKRLLKSIKTT